MKIQYLVPVVLYYVLIGLVFAFLPSEVMTGASTPADLQSLENNSTGFSQSEVNEGFFTAITSIATGTLRFALFATVGVGLPSDCPDFIKIIWSSWSIIILFISIALIISAFWNG